jgi:asparagine synthase (glutamine-hydrolysing)
MCGICGVFCYMPDAPLARREELLAMRESMAKRGPDGSGIWFASNGTAGLGHRRLAILDPTEAGAQPMSIAAGRYWITFNGEIYNFRELRDGLEGRGYKFRTNSDTEVLLHLYADEGGEMVRRLRGMFAFAIWDDLERRLFLARDPFGIKPLYYSDGGGVFRFASQVKALLAGGYVDAAPDPAGHVGFFLLGSVPEPWTTYKAIRALPAGSTMTVSMGGPKAPSAYFLLRDEMLRAESEARPVSIGETQAIVADALRDSVRHHLVSDVPVGLFLSAGIDSSVVLAAASESARDSMRTVTLGFREYKETGRDETLYATRTAAAYGARHETRLIERRDFDESIDDILASMDQPSIDGVNTWFISRAAAQTGLKVALSGLGGDELFGGYPSFRDVPRLEALPAFSKRAPRASRWLRKAASAVTGRVISPKYAGLLELAGMTSGAYLLRRGLFMPWELGHVMDRDMAAQGLESLQLMPSLGETVSGLRSKRMRVAALEISWYMRNQLLRDADWAGMAHSLEIRVPMVDVQFFRALLPTLASPKPPEKSVLACAPSRPLPRALVERAKSGFEVPVAQWMKSGSAGRARGLRGWARRVNRAPGVGHRLIALCTDGFGGRGGIALYMRDLLSALAAHGGVREIVALPRVIVDEPTAVPAKVTHWRHAAGGKLRYLFNVLRAVWSVHDADVIVCGHLNLTPIAAIAKWWTGCPVLLCIYGIEAWRPRGPIAATCLRCVDAFLSISELTRERFLVWSKMRVPGYIVPNAIHLDWYSPGPKNPKLLDRYGLRDRKILITVGRLVSSERYKGFDEVIDVMPKLLKQIPELAYLVVGDGLDRPRLQKKAQALGIAGRVVFTGYIDEKEKADHYRLADAYVMPSQGEGFGFVHLEALACGIPALGSRLDGSREALRNGSLGVLVDPNDPDDVRRGIVATLGSVKGAVPSALSYFAYPNFERRCKQLLDDLLYGVGADQGVRNGEHLEPRAR